MSALEIPDELLAEANRVPGLRERVARFIKLEVIQHELRQKRFRPETLALVSRAKALADEKRLTGVDFEAEKAKFLHRLKQMTSSDSL